jgi:hypothetical protein
LGVKETSISLASAALRSTSACSCGLNGIFDLPPMMVSRTLRGNQRVYKYTLVCVSTREFKSASVVTLEGRVGKESKFSSNISSDL